MWTGETEVLVVQIGRQTGYGEPLGSAELRPLEEEEEAGLWLGAELEKVKLGPGAADAGADADADFCANRVPATENRSVLIKT